MAGVSISKKNKILKGEITLPGSKSESNRALIIQALCKDSFEIHNLSPAEDTLILESEVGSRKSEAGSQISDIRHAGTTFRFLTAYYASLPGSRKILTGSERMKQRPIGHLVESLRKLGADISYMEKEGYPPLQINGKILDQTNEIDIEANVSSQFISALLLIAPVLPHELIMNLENEIVSEPYIEMTLSMMQHFGVHHQREKNKIIIQKQEYKAKDIFIEADWSSASYWYSMAALSDEVDLTLKGLKGYSLQGDSIIAELMANFGVSTQFLHNGIRLGKTNKRIERKIFDLKEYPDLAQTLIVTCAALGYEATFTGLQTLRIKETDRIQALQNELKKVGAELIEKGQVYKLVLTENNSNHSFNPFIHTYNDHRMAMSFAPLAIQQEIAIEDPDVVNKSYPSFWKDMGALGFEIRDVRHGNI